MKLTKGKGWASLYIKPDWLFYAEWDFRHWFIGFSLYIWDGGWNLQLSIPVVSLDIGRDDDCNCWLEQED